MSVFGLFNKTINFIITESVKKPTIYDLLFLTGIYSLKNINKYPSEMKNLHQSSFFIVGVVFPNMEPYFDGRSEMLTCHQTFSRNFFTLSHVIKNSKRICAPSGVNRV